MHGPLDPVSISPYRLFVIQYDLRSIEIVCLPNNILDWINIIFTAMVRGVIPVLKEE